MMLDAGWWREERRRSQLRRIATCALGTLLLFGAMSPSARNPGMPPGVGSAVIRAQSHALSRAVSKNIETLIRPRLRVTRGGTGPVSALALSENEQRLVTAVGDKSVRVWDLRIGREVARLRGLGSRVTAVAVSPDGAYAFAQDQQGDVYLWALDQGGKPLKLPKAFPRRQGPAVFVETAETLYLVVGGADGSLSLWSPASRRESGRIQVHPGGVRALAAGLGKAGLVVAEGADGRRVVVDIGRRQRVRELASAPTDMPSSRIVLDTERVAAVDGSGRLTLWGLDDGQVRHSWKAQEAALTAVGINAVGGQVATGGRDGVIRLWSRTNGAPMGELKGHEGPVHYVQFNRDGTLLLSGSDDGTTRVWQLSTGQPLVTLISTTEGWAVVDAFGRFEGSDLALSGIDWTAPEEDLPINAFSPGYYQPGLVPSALHTPASLEEVRNITRDGVHLPPSVSFASPLPQRAEPQELTVRVAAEDRGGGVEDLLLFQNGKRVRGLDISPTGTAEGELTRSYQIQVAPGENVLAARALSREGIESQPAVAVIRGEGVVPKSKLHLVMVGVSRFGLRYPVPDSRAIERLIQERGRVLFTSVEVEQVFDAAATRAGILASLRELRTASPVDVAVVYLAGHGGTVEGEWYFVPEDVGALNAARIKAEGISAATLRAELEAIAPQRVLLLIDACDAGLALTPVEDFTGLRTLRLLARSVGLHVLAATDRDRYALEVDALSHSVFAYAVLDALKGKGDLHPRNSLVSVSELVAFVEEAVPRLSQQYAKSPRYPNGYPQIPTGHSQGAGFDLVKVSR